MYPTSDTQPHPYFLHKAEDALKRACAYDADPTQLAQAAQDEKLARLDTGDAHYPRAIVNRRGDVIALTAWTDDGGGHYIMHTHRLDRIFIDTAHVTGLDKPTPGMSLDYGISCLTRATGEQLIVIPLERVACGPSNYRPKSAA